MKYTSNIISQHHIFGLFGIFLVKSICLKPYSSFIRTKAPNLKMGNTLPKFAKKARKFKLILILWLWSSYVNGQTHTEHVLLLLDSVKSWKLSTIKVHIRLDNKYICGWFLNPDVLCPILPHHLRKLLPYNKYCQTNFVQFEWKYM